MQTNAQDLQILIAVADTGSFTAAADALSIPSSKASRAVSRTEQALGVTLFNRTTRKVSLTEEGKTFIANIRQGLAILTKAESDITSQGQPPRGKLRVDAASPFVLNQLVPLVSEFTAAYPYIELEISSNEGYVDLLEHRTDVAIRIGQLTDSTLHARPLGQSRLFVVASPNYLKKYGAPLTPNDLTDHQIVGFTSPKILNEWPLPGVPKLTNHIQCSSGETVRQLCIAGNGIACLSGFMIKKEVLAGKLKVLFDQSGYEHKTRGLINGVYYKSSAVSKRISVFLDFIQPRLEL